MKKYAPALVGFFCGLLLLLSFFFKGPLESVGGIIFQILVLLISVAFLLAIASLLLNQINNLIHSQRGAMFPLVFVVVFGVTLLFSLIWGVDHPDLQRPLALMQTSLETAFLGLGSLIMAGASLQVFRVRGWTPLSVAFGLSAIAFLLITLGFFQIFDLPPVFSRILLVIQSLPVIGARGLLIGMALGTLMMGIRVLVNKDLAEHD